MLVSGQRLRKRSEFDAVFKKGKSISSFLCILRWLPRDGGLPRFGFVVSNKISKKATERNRIKRRMREIVRRYPLPIGPFDIVLIARGPMKTAQFDEIKKTLHALLGKVGGAIPHRNHPPVSKNTLPRP